MGNPLDKLMEQLEQKDKVNLAQQKERIGLQDSLKSELHENHIPELPGNARSERIIKWIVLLVIFSLLIAFFAWGLSSCQLPSPTGIDVKVELDSLIMPPPPFHPKNPFNHISYDRVVAYDYTGGGAEEVESGTINIIGEDGKLASTVTKEVELSKAQIDSLLSCICDSASYGNGFAQCFDPHLGIVFYDQNKVSAYVSICIECNRLRSSLDIPAQSARVNKTKYGDIPIEGFSRIARDKINALCQSLNFSHCRDSLSHMFDK